MSRFLRFVHPRALSRMTVLAGLAVVLLACGGENGQQAAEAESNETASASTDTTAKAVEVTMKDHAYEPSSITVPAGQKVTLKFKNAGTVEHYFVVGDTIASSKDGFRQNLFSGVSLEKSKKTGGHSEESEEHGEEDEHHADEFELPPGGSGAMTFTLPPSKAGTYTFACFETTGNKKHYEMGMKGTLTVTASAGN